MQEFITLLFKEYEFAQDDIERYTKEFAGVAFLALLDAHKKELEGASFEIQKEFAGGEIDKIIKRMSSRYASEEEWQKAVAGVLRPLVESYISEVRDGKVAPV